MPVLLVGKWAGSVVVGVGVLGEGALALAVGGEVCRVAVVAVVVR